MCAEHNFREKSLGLREGTHGEVQTTGSELRFLQASSLLWYPQKLSIVGGPLGYQFPPATEETSKAVMPIPQSINYIKLSADTE